MEFYHKLYIYIFEREQKGILGKFPFVFNKH